MRHGNGFRDLTNQRFERLLILAYHDTRGRKAFWRCLCDCGKLRFVPTQDLVAGKTKSCGCWSRDQASALNYKHGLSGSREYTIWSAMKNRCHNPNDEFFRDYGARGIRVCEKWRSDFSAFYGDMGARPSPRHSIDRINNDGNYEPQNCRWASPLEQSSNRRHRSCARRESRAPRPHAP